MSVGELKQAIDALGVSDETPVVLHGPHDGGYVTSGWLEEIHDTGERLELRTRDEEGPIPDELEEPVERLT